MSPCLKKGEKMERVTIQNGRRPLTRTEAWTSLAGELADFVEAGEERRGIALSGFSARAARGICREIVEARRLPVSVGGRFGTVVLTRLRGKHMAGRRASR